MKDKDYKLIIVKDGNEYTAYFENPTLKGIIVQCCILQDIPKEIAKLIEVMLKYGFDKNIHEVININEFTSK